MLLNPFQFLLQKILWDSMSASNRSEKKTRTYSSQVSATNTQLHIPYLFKGQRKHLLGGWFAPILKNNVHQNGWKSSPMFGVQIFEYLKSPTTLVIVFPKGSQPPASRFFTVRSYQKPTAQSSASNVFVHGNSLLVEPGGADGQQDHTVHREAMKMWWCFFSTIAGLYILYLYTSTVLYIYNI